jgi:RNA-binding proteins (RRM domain)
MTVHLELDFRYSITCSVCVLTCDVLCFMLVLRYGEVVNLNLVRDKATGKSKGFCFLCYEDQRSTVLAVDNLNGIKVCIALLCVLNNYLVKNELSILRCFPII